MDTDDERIRREAHKLWEGEGRPDGRAERHWAEAREIIALRDSNRTTLKSLRETLAEPVEPAVATESLGDLPGLADQGEETLTPSRDAAEEVADEAPLATDGRVKATSKSKAKASKKDAASKKDVVSKRDKAPASAAKSEAKAPAKRKSKPA